MAVRKERNNTLRLLSLKKQRAFQEPFLQSTRSVLLEQDKRAGMLGGYTDNYIPVCVPASEGTVNEITAIHLDHMHEDLIVGGFRADH